MRSVWKGKKNLKKEVLMEGKDKEEEVGISVHKWSKE